jgi:hypothetical protein
MFDGSTREKRAVRLGGRSTVESNEAMLRRVRAERLQRSEERAKVVAGKRLQAWCAPLFRAQPAAREAPGPRGAPRTPGAPRPNIRPQVARPRRRARVAASGARDVGRPDARPRRAHSLRRRH